MKKSRTLTAGALLFTGIVALAGCSGAAGGSTTSGGKGGELTYWSMWTESEPQAAVLKSAISAFEKESGVKVSVQWQGRQVLDQVTAGLSAGTAPDLVDQSYDRIGPALNGQNALADLKDVWDLKNSDGKKVSEAVNTNIAKVIPTYGGSVTDYMIPYTVSSVSLFYNGKSPYLSAPPKTYEDLLNACDKAKAAGVGCIASDADAAWASEYWFDYLLDREAGDGAVSKLFNDKTGKAWDAPEVKTAAQHVRDLIDKGYMTADYDASKYPAARDGWAQGKSVFYLTGSWVASETKDLVGSDWKYVGANFPTLNASRSTALSVLPFGFAVPSVAKNQDAAKKFIAFFSSEKYEGQIAEKAGNLTALKGAAAPAALESVQKDIDNNPTRIAFDGANGEIFAKVFDSTFNDLWLGKSTPDQFVAASKDGQIQFWKSKG